ncbi:MAG TPA: class I SAM-dependent methyltransferase, partial [Xanthobacteraceae bacterium]|nr:class I SAM-dependent methyltransferase [Xanthobacteraceae bacterium]
MSAFSIEWLSLREPYDLVARNATVLDAVASAFLDQTAISIVDLACGTGATLRAVGPHLPPRQNWRLVDNNLSLLAQVARPAGLPQVSVITRPVDLARDLELALDGPLDLVTASALLDLVSAEWLDRLIVEA